MPGVTRGHTSHRTAQRRLSIPNPAVLDATNVPNATAATNVPDDDEAGHNVGSGAGAAGGVAFGDELLAGLEDGVAGDAEFAGERAGTGEAGAGLDPALANRRPQRSVELTVQGAVVVELEPHA